MTNEFSERYRNLSLADLLSILDNPGSYRPEAIEAARLELESRKATEEELTASRSELENRTSDPLTRLKLPARKPREVRDHQMEPQGVLEDVLLVEAPFGHSYQWKVPFAASVQLVLAIFLIVYNSEYYSRALEVVMVGKILYIYYLLPILLSLAAGIFLLRKRRIGWYLSVISLMNTIVNWVLHYKTNGLPLADGDGFFLTRLLIGYGGESFAGQYGYLVQYIDLITCTVLLFFVAGKSVRHFFGIKKQACWLTLGLAFTGTTILFYFG